MKLAFLIISWGRCTVKQPSSKDYVVYIYVCMYVCILLEGKMNKIAEVPKLFVQSAGYLFSGNSKKVFNYCLETFENVL